MATSIVPVWSLREIYSTLMEPQMDLKNDKCILFVFNGNNIDSYIKFQQFSKSKITFYEYQNIMFCEIVKHILQHILLQ